MASLLKKFVDAEQWDAEDIAGRLGMVMHAAFLFAGFQPYGAEPRSGHLLKRQSCKKGGSLCLSRQYTAPDLAQREGADSAVLMLCVQGDDVAILVFLTTTDGGGDAPENAYLERVDLGTVRPLLSRSLGGVEPWASRICRSLANGVCWGFLDELCRGNGLPLTCFTSLPDDIKGAILEKLNDGKDLGRVECVSSQIRLLVAKRYVELWEPLYKALPARERLQRRSFLTPRAPTRSWKNKYVEQTIKNSCYFDSSGPIQMIRLSWPLFFSKVSKKFCPILVRRGKSSWPHECWLFQHPTEEDHPTEEEEMVSMRVQRRSDHRRKLAQSDCKKKWNGVGTINSPSSRYQ